MPNYYELLNASSTASFDELKWNYKQLILQYHPDKLQQERESMRTITVSAVCDPNPTSQFNAINEAWNTLKDPIKRKHYDAELLQTKFQTHSNIYASVALNDMRRIEVELEETDDEEQGEQSVGKRAEADTNTDKETTTAALGFAYAFDCRCGGQYVLDETAVAAAAAAVDGGGNDNAVSGGGVGGGANDESSATLNAEQSQQRLQQQLHSNASIASEMIVECNECSLVIIVKPQIN